MFFFFVKKRTKYLYKLYFMILVDDKIYWGRSIIVRGANVWRDNAETQKKNGQSVYVVAPL